MESPSGDPSAGIIGVAMDLQGGFRVATWDVFPLTGDIRSAGDFVHLEPKVMEVLVALAGRAGSVVLRDELLATVWGPRAAISDEPLTRCIAQLRQAFGDSARNSRIIQTIPKRGYRLMQPVVPIEPAAAEPEAFERQEMPNAIDQGRRQRPWPATRWLKRILYAKPSGGPSDGCLCIISISL